jgi:4-amino-4-deoxy-L-arabinose transferase-like glycosyltransferase
MSDMRNPLPKVLGSKGRWLPYLLHRVDAPIIVVFLLALTLRVAFAYLFKAEIVEGVDPWYYDITAKGIVAGEGYHVRNLLAYCPPVFTYFLAGIYYIFGTGVWWTQVVLALVGAINCILIYFIGSEMGSKRVGIIAATLSAVYPQLIWYSVQLYTETLFFFLFLSATAIMFLAAKKQMRLLLFISGFLFGLATLTREVGFFGIVGVLIWLTIERKSLASGLKRWIPIVVVACLTILPWTIRNYLVFGALVPVSTNGGINFYIGNNPQATGRFMWVVPPTAKWNVAAPDGRYELEASRLGYKEGVEFIRENPAKFLKLTLTRVFFYWSPPFQNISLELPLTEMVYRIVWLVLYVIIVFLAVVAAPFLLRSEWRKWSFLWIMIIFLSAPYCLTFISNSSRFQLTTIPFLIIIASGAFHRVLQQRDCKRSLLQASKE